MGDGRLVVGKGGDGEGVAGEWVRTELYDIDLICSLLLIRASWWLRD